MSKVEKQSAALALVQDKDVGAVIPLNQLQQVAVAQFQRIARDTRDTPLRAILLGLTLHRVKATMQHGTFEAWKKANLTQGNIWSESTAIKNASFYMRLATAAIASTEATKPELLALPGDQTELALNAEGQSRKFVDKLQAFIDERTLDQLLRDEGIKDANKKKKKTGAAATSAAPSEAEKEVTVQDRFNEIEAALKLAREGATDKATWMAMSTQQHTDLKDMFEAAADRVCEVFVKTHGRKK